VNRRVLRSWPWTIALALVVMVFIALGMFGISLRTSVLEAGISLVLVLAGLLALYRVLTSGVHVLPSGVIVRELTRSTPVPWARVRSITTGPTGRKGVFAPVLVTQNGKLELTILAAYSQAVAERRAEELRAARRAHTS
jgi:hypothetical protein